MKTLRSKIFACSLGLVLAILFIVFLFQVVFLKDVYEYYKVSDVKRIQKEMVEQFNHQDVHKAYESVWEMAQENELYVAIFDSHRREIMSPMLYMQNQKSPFLYNKVFFDNYLRVLNNAVDYLEQNDTGTYVTYGRRGAELFVVSRIYAADGTFYILTRSEVVPVKATTDILARIYIYLLLISVVFAAVVAYLLSKHITKPIRQLSEGARAVREGNLNYAIPESATAQNEMTALIHDFNTMTAELSRTDALRKDFVANVSHELRTPLTMIKGYAETVRDLTGDNPEKREKQLGIIIEESDRLTDLIHDLLDLSQIQAGHIQFEKQQMDFSDMMRCVLERYTCFAEQGYQIEAQIADNVFVVGDQARLEQVLYNLMDNAINHCGEQKRVDVLLTGGMQPRLSVSNTGEAISEEDIAYIWERFYHADSTGKRRVTGTGIGLSLVREILENHGFAYGVSSVPEHTEFWVSLYSVTN